MRNLEAELGKQLFVRSGPSIEPTAAAIALASCLAEALWMIEDAVSECRSPAQSLRLTSVPSFAVRWLAPRLARYYQRQDARPVQLDVSVDLRSAKEFDIAIRTGRGDWPDFESTRLIPVDVTPMLSPTLAARVRPESPVDLTKLPLLPHDDWLQWFRLAGVHSPDLRFCVSEYPTYELDAVAAVEGAGVALLSPTLFAPLVREGRLVQPFVNVMRGPDWHYLLLRRGETRAAVHEFRAWLQDEMFDRPGRHP
jgi:LysR family glycine cleavage system transcriptional activator